MSRPRDPVTHYLLPPPHKRLDMAPFQEAALFAMAADPRASALPVTRKLAMIDKAVDHIIDGDKPPAWVWKADDYRPENHFLRDLWGIATGACAAVKVRAREDAAR